VCETMFIWHTCKGAMHRHSEKARQQAEAVKQAARRGARRQVSEEGGGIFPPC